MSLGDATRLRVAIVDDEPLARQGLRIRLQKLDGLAVVAELGDPTAALDVLAATPHDVLFLDVSMPEMDGFSLLERMERPALPAIVFVTAFADHAVRAFRVGAVDYLVKPYDDETLRQSVDRARAYVDRARATAIPQGSGKPESRILVKHGGLITILQMADIEWVESSGDLVRIHSGGRIYTIRSTLSAFARRLDPARFVRVHRTSIVAITFIRALEPYSRGEYIVMLADGTRVPLSRRSRERVLHALGSR